MNELVASRERESESVWPVEQLLARPRLRVIFWSIAIIFGFAQAWNSRYEMNSDGISYLDMADAYLSGGWKMLVNGHWSPMYPFLLAVTKALARPSRYWEFALVHLVNFLIFLLALVAYEWMLGELIGIRPSPLEEKNGLLALPRWALETIGYLVFLSLSLTLVSLERVSPDLLMSVFVYLAMALVLQIRNRGASWLRFTLLGCTLGLGYYSKTPMFPLGFIILGLCLFSTSHLKRALPRVALAAAMMLAVSAPLLVALSHMAGRFSFGESGRWNYLTVIDDAGPLWYWHDLGRARGKLEHPPQRVFDHPSLYTFVGPVGGTLPAWYDPYYWSVGAKPRLVLGRQIATIIYNGKLCFDLVFDREAALLVLFLVLLIIGNSRFSLMAARRLWLVWAPALLAICMYLLVLVQERYVAVFLIILWSALFSSLRLKPTAQARQLVVASTVALVLVLGVPLALSAAEDLHGLGHRRHTSWEVAESMRAMGLEAGDRVGRIGGLRRVEWARLLGIRVIAEIPPEEAEYFWSSDPSRQSEILDKFREAGAIAVIADGSPPAVFIARAGWRRMGDSYFYAYRLGSDGPSHPVRR